MQKEFINPNEELLTKLSIDKQGSFIYRRRRQPDWVDSYLLYRDKVMLNRLTQRQSVNVPLIKSSIKTLLKDIDDPPILYFSNLDNDEQAEVYFNEYWKYNSIRNNLILKDIVDKRQVLLFGRSFKSLNIKDGHFYWEIVDPQDILIDRYVDPSDIDSARFLIHEHIYVPLASLRTNPAYDNSAVKRIAEYMDTDSGLVKAEENQLDWVEKQRREAGLGVIDAFNPILGETYVELNKWFIKEFNEDTLEDDIKYIVTCEDMEVLYSCKLEEYIGTTEDHYWNSHYPYTTWGDETERTDFWSDGVSDTLRTLNKILNSFFSQKVENRTLRSFGMNYFNSSLTDEGFLPQTFDPVPWGWYPIPVGDGQKIQDQILRVDIPDLSDVDKDMEFIMQIAQQASAATTMQEGVKPQGENITLGEVQILTKNAEQRIKSMAVYYTESWKEFALKFTKMMEGASDLVDDVTIYKKGRNTNKNYAKNIKAGDWKTESMYRVDVQVKTDMDAKTAEDLQKLQYSKSLMPTNKLLDKTIKKKSLEFADIPAAEISEILKEDEVNLQALQGAGGVNPMGGGGMTPGQGGMPPPQIPGVM